MIYRVRVDGVLESIILEDTYSICLQLIFFLTCTYSIHIDTDTEMVVINVEKMNWNQA